MKTALFTILTTAHSYNLVIWGVSGATFGFLQYVVNPDLMPEVAESHPLNALLPQTLGLPQLHAYGIPIHLNGISNCVQSDARPLTSQYRPSSSQTRSHLAGLG